MTPSTPPDDDTNTTPPPGSAAPRMLVGLLQGLALYGLSLAWSDTGWATTHPMLFRPLLLVALLVPLVLVSGMSHMRSARLLAWCLGLAVLLGAMGVYDAWRSDLGALPINTEWPDEGRSWLPSGLMILLVPGLFIAQAMILAGSADGRLLARYRSYFAIAWKLMLQLAFALTFTLLLWLVLQTGATLFGLLKLHFLRTLLEQRWFYLPVTTLAVASALHLTDVRPAILAGMRRLLLTVLSWLLPLATVLVAAFLAALLVAGLQPLWVTRMATAVLLGSAALLVFLINVVYQDGVAGEHHPAPARAMRWCLRLACLLPAPLVALAAYALALRVAQYGWTVERITAALAVLVAAVYAIGYAVAALTPRRRLSWVAPVNVAASLVLLAVLVAVLTPLGDPARLAAADQVARLRAGKIALERFDFRFLRFDTRRHGVDALRALAQTPGEAAAPLRAQAQQALERTNRWQESPQTVARADLNTNVHLHGGLQALPEGFRETDWRTVEGAVSACLRVAGAVCDAYPVQLPGSTQQQLLLLSTNDMARLYARDGSTWSQIGSFYTPTGCSQQLRDAAEHGTLTWLPPRQFDIALGDTRLALRPAESHRTSCTALAAAPVH